MNMQDIREALKKELQQIPDSLLHELKDYMEFLQYRHACKVNEKQRKEWKKNIHNLPQWEEKDLLALEGNQKLFTKWDIQEW